MQGRNLRPLAQLPKAAAQCAQAGAAYGKCIGARYQDVDKGMCAAEFQAFRQCVTQAVSPALPFVLHMLELWLTLRTRCPGLDEATGPFMRRFRQSVQDSQDTRAGSAHRDVCHFRQTSTSNPQILRSFPSPPLALADARLSSRLNEPLVDSSNHSHPLILRHPSKQNLAALALARDESRASCFCAPRSGRPNLSHSRSLLACWTDVSLGAASWDGGRDSQRFSPKNPLLGFYDRAPYCKRKSRLPRLPSFLPSLPSRSVLHLVSFRSLGF
uniref:Uncharacterized protein n=1 Tax=Rhodotorula toruloides TaxID=5286 RepID=A0A0K3C744_RHOTO